MSEHDVIVVGGGLVGSALSLALVQGGLRPVLVEPAPPQLPADDSWDSRIYAISPGNAAFLRRLGAWDAMDAGRVAPIHAMRIWGDDGAAEMGFDAYEVGVPELGYIVESRLIQGALWRTLQAQQDIEMVVDSGASLELGKMLAHLTLTNGRMLEAPLLVGADGGNSWVRRQSGIGVSTMPYGQLGVVANFETEKPHGNIARQWFLRDGILAWLPLPGNRISIVWSAFEARAQELLKLGPEVFCQAVEHAGYAALGRLTLITPPAAFPLRLQRNDAMVAPRLALVGDAAHLVHPLAGQGVNLGFHDARDLASTVLGRGMFDLGDQILLRRYERARKTDILAMQAVTSGLQRLFNNHDPVLGWLRNNGLAAVDRIPNLKHQLMAHAIL